MKKAEFTKKYQTALIWGRFNELTDEAVSYAFRNNFYAQVMEGCPERITEADKAWKSKQDAKTARIVDGIIAKKERVSALNAAVKKAFEASGIVWKAISETNFGVSIYGEWNGQKVRVSNHSTGEKRFMNEINFRVVTIEDVPVKFAL
jgi:hypothetical protein